MSEAVQPELWTDQEIAEFHLNNALDEEGYRWAVAEVLSMGIDPTTLPYDHLFRDDHPWRRPELYMPPRTQQQGS